MKSRNKEKITRYVEANMDEVISKIFKEVCVMYLETGGKDLASLLRKVQERRKNGDSELEGLLGMLKEFQMEKF